MSAITSSVASEVDEEYDAFAEQVRESLLHYAAPVFTTDADPDALWGAYLGNFPEGPRRQHYNCHCCRQFIKSFGGLVNIEPQSKARLSCMWKGFVSAPDFFAKSTREMFDIVSKAKITGVFLSSDKFLGTPKTGEWSHLCCENNNVYTGIGYTAGQMMAQKREEYGMLCHALSEYSVDVVEQAVRILSSDSVYRSEKAEAIAKWFLQLYKDTADQKGVCRSNPIWLAVATAPPGFCHVRSTMISTMLDDIKNGVAFDVIARKWKEKMHPLQYQRPTAAPSNGAIEQAEKLVEKLGVAPAFGRRYATLDDVLNKEWTPRPLQEKVTETGGVFDHLKVSPPKVTEFELPEQPITWEKFRERVLPDALSMDIMVGMVYQNFYGLVTATDPTAPAIIQWDGLEEHPRNPVSWFFYHNGSHPGQWGLSPGWQSVTAVFLNPSRWQEPEKFTHQGNHVFFAIQDCRDTGKPTLCLFPEILKSEFHGIRSVIEAHSKKGTITGSKESNANGIAFQKDKPVTVRVKTTGGYQRYTIDRFD